VQFSFQNPVLLSILNKNPVKGYFPKEKRAAVIRQNLRPGSDIYWQAELRHDPPYTQARMNSCYKKECFSHIYLNYMIKNNCVKAGLFLI
jgi:hypothetical protein